MWLMNALSGIAEAGFLTLGHLALWVMVINRLHATGLPRPFIKAIDKVIYLAVVGIPLVVTWRLYSPGTLLLGGLFESYWLNLVWRLYAVGCLLVAFVVVLTWLKQR